MVCYVLTPIGLFQNLTPVILTLGLGRCQKSSWAGFSLVMYFSNDDIGHLLSCSNISWSFSVSCFGSFWWPYIQTAASAPRIPCAAKQLGYNLTIHQYHTDFPCSLHLSQAYVCGTHSLALQLLQRSEKDSILHSESLTREMSIVLR